MTIATQTIKGWMLRACEFLRVSWRGHAIAFRMVPFPALATVLLSISTAVFGFLLAWVNARLVDEIIASAGAGIFTAKLIGITVLAIGLFVMPDLIGSLRDFIDRLFWLRLSVFLDVLFLRSRLAADIATHERPSYQDSLAKSTDRGIYPILNILDSQFALLADILMFVIALVILYGYNPLYVFILIAGVLPKLVVGMRYAEQSWTLHDLNAEDRRKFYFLRDFPDQGPRLMEAHLLGLRPTMTERLRTLADSFTDRRVSVERRRLAWDTGATLIMMVSIGAVYALGIRAVVAGGITIGSFLFLSAAIGRFGDPLARIFMGVSRQYEWSRYSVELFRIFDVAPALATPRHPQDIDLTRAPEIRFENVSFRYPGTDKDVLSGLTLTIRPGESLALVGINGAGKTTLVKLICRFYDPTRGRILVNGVDLREIDLHSWYRALAVLFQHFAFYKSFTVGESIALGDVDTPRDDAHIHSAAEDAGADSIVAEFPRGYEQMLGKEFTGGVDPSRGQEQRLALSRMFYRHARCLILDEPTAAVDAETEEHIFRTIEGMQGRTRILISHRFSTVRNADQICVLDGGQVREIGTHHELMAKKGEYARLFRMQAAGYADDVGDEVVLLTGETQNPAKKKKNGMRRVAEKKNIKKEVVKGKNPPSLIHQKSSAMGS